MSGTGADGRDSDSADGALGAPSIGDASQIREDIIRRVTGKSRVTRAHIEQLLESFEQAVEETASGRKAATNGAEASTVGGDTSSAGGPALTELESLGSFMSLRRAIAICAGLCALLFGVAGFVIAAWRVLYLPQQNDTTWNAYALTVGPVVLLVTISFAFASRLASVAERMAIPIHVLSNHPEILLPPASLKAFSLRFKKSSALFQFGSAPKKRRKAKQAEEDKA